MKINVRRNVFETNSSSTHSITIGKHVENMTLVPQVALTYKYDYESKAYPFMALYGYEYSGTNGLCSSAVCRTCPCYNKYADECNSVTLEMHEIWERKYHCAEYTQGQQKKYQELINSQDFNCRASYLLTTIICMTTKPEKYLLGFIELLSQVCDVITLNAELFDMSNNTLEYWKDITFDLGTYDSSCYMELHDSPLRFDEDVLPIITDKTLLIDFLFGEGSYFGVDRDGSWGGV